MGIIIRLNSRLMNKRIMGMMEIITAIIMVDKRMIEIRRFKIN